MIIKTISDAEKALTRLSRLQARIDRIAARAEKQRAKASAREARRLRKPSERCAELFRALEVFFFEKLKPTLPGKTCKLKNGLLSCHDYFHWNWPSDDVVIAALVGRGQAHLVRRTPEPDKDGIKKCLPLEEIQAMGVTRLPATSFAVKAGTFDHRQESKYRAIPILQTPPKNLEG